MQVFLQKDAKTLDIECAGTARGLLAQLAIAPDTVLIVKDGVLITEEDTIDGAERIDLLSVVSGG